MTERPAVAPPTPDAGPPGDRRSLAAWARGRLRRDLANWRLFLVRILTSALAVVGTIAVLPGLHFTSWYSGAFLVLGAVFGLLNALVKPLIQFFALRYLVASYGLVVIVINALMLGLLSLLLGDMFTTRGVVPFFLGGLLVGVFGLVLDTVAGTTPPVFEPPPAVVDDPEPELLGSRSSGASDVVPTAPATLVEAGAVLAGPIDDGDAR